MQIIKTSAFPGFTVQVDANELQCKHRAMPFAAYIGSVKPDASADDSRKGYCKILIWTPGVSGLPRGYRDAAKEFLVKVAISQGFMVDNRSFHKR